MCAYILGPCGSLCKDKFARCFPSLHECTGPLDTGCVIAFDNRGEPGPPGWEDKIAKIEKGEELPRAWADTQRHELRAFG